MVHFVGAGPGAPDLITLRGAALLKQADVIIYAGSLVNPALLELARADCEVHNSAEMTLEQVIDVMVAAEAAGTKVIDKYADTYCCADWQRCTLARALIEFYEREDCGNGNHE